MAEAARGAAAPILMAADVTRVIDRMAHQILEKTHGGADVALIGIPTRGVPLAARLADRIGAFENVELPVGRLDITLYRDDLRLRGIRPLAETVEPDGGVTDRLVILVDDVCSLAGPSARRWTRCAISAARVRCNSPCLWIAVTASYRSGPTTSARTYRHRSGRRCVCCSPRPTDGMPCSSTNPESPPTRRLPGEVPR